MLSVDGRDAVTGRVGDFVNLRGYVIDPYANITVEGFRQSWGRVASFQFTSPGDSYSARQGTPQNVGVVGVAFFPERRQARTGRDMAVFGEATLHAPRARADN